MQPIAIENVTTTPTIQALYYGALIVNEAIGTGANTKIAELPVNNTNTVAYGIWEGDRLARAVLINNNLYLPGNVSRTSEVFNLLGFKAASGSDTVSIRRFYTPASNATTGL